MPNLNSCNLIGHLGKDAEINKTDAGKTIVNLSLAVSSGWGEYKRTAWTRISVFGKNAEWIAADGAKKGDLCIVINAEYRVDDVEKGDKIERYHSCNVGGIGQNCRIVPRNSDDRAEEQDERRFKSRKEDNTPEPEGTNENNKENFDDLPF